jgi:hypothetical protein
MTPGPRSFALNGIAIGLAMIFGVWLRFNGLNWDAGLLLHPDEWNLVSGAARLRWGSDPGFYAYNGFALISTRAVTYLGWLLGWAADPVAIKELSHGARLLSATSSVATIAVLTLLARQISDRAGATAIAWLVACDVGSVQSAHFGTTESFLVLCFSVLALLATSHLVKRLSFWPFILLSSIALALGVGVKTSALAGAVMPALTIVLSSCRPTAWRTSFAVLVIMLVVAGIFFAVSPHSMLNPRLFLETMKFEGNIVNGSLDVFWTRQFAGSLPYVFQIAQLPWLQGPIVPGLGLAGASIVCISIARGQRRWISIFPVVVFTLLYFAYVGMWYAKFVRYLLPLVPGLYIGLLVTYLAIAELGPRFRRFAHFAGGLTVLSSIGWALSFTSIYRHDDSRIAASHYLVENAGVDDMILIEPRDVGLPLGVSGADGRKVEVLPLMDEDHPTLGVELAEKLANGKWIVIASQRNYGNLPRLRRKYPVVCPYYKALFAGALGFDLAVRFVNDPSLFGFSIDTREAEETFTVFDHPTVFLFRKSSKMTATEIKSKIELYSLTAKCGFSDLSKME